MRGLKRLRGSSSTGGEPLAGARLSVVACPVSRLYRLVQHATKLGHEQALEVDALAIREQRLLGEAAAVASAERVFLFAACLVVPLTVAPPFGTVSPARGVPKKRPLALVCSLCVFHVGLRCIAVGRLGNVKGSRASREGSPVFDKGLGAAQRDQAAATL